MSTSSLALPAQRSSLRSVLTTLLKALLTVGVFWILLRHPVDDAGGKVPVWRAIANHIAEMNPATFWTFVLLGTAIKLVGIVASMYRWQLLLRGQGIELPFWHIVGSFLIGRFYGTFLPSTIGLDGYKLWDAYRFSGRAVEPTTATLVEKITGGFLGLFLTYLVTLPMGYRVLAHETIAGNRDR